MAARSTAFRTMCAFVFFFQAEDGIRDGTVTGVQTCALPISSVGLGDEARCEGQDDKADRDVDEEGPAPRAHVGEESAEQQAEGGASGGDGTEERSEERRVGKECRTRWEPDHEEKQRRREKEE